MSKNIGILIREIPAEGLRVSGGLSILDDPVSVFVMDQALGTSPDTEMALSMVRELGLPVWAMDAHAGSGGLSVRDFAGRLLEQDVVLTF